MPATRAKQDATRRRALPRNSPAARPAARAGRPSPRPLRPRALVSFTRGHAHEGGTGERRAPAFRDCGSRPKSQETRLSPHAGGPAIPGGPLLDDETGAAGSTCGNGRRSHRRLCLSRAAVCPPRRVAGAFILVVPRFAFARRVARRRRFLRLTRPPAYRPRGRFRPRSGLISRLTSSASPTS